MANEKPGALIALSESGDSHFTVQSPAVGHYSSLPQPGVFLPGGSFVGRIKILNTYYDLYLPGDVSGMVVIEGEKDFDFPVEYGQALFRLNRDKHFLELGDQVARIISRPEDNMEFEDGFVITAFTPGIFYTKPGPDSPPFVTVGQEIEKGKALGLIEVMKTFNHIVFQGTDNGDVGVIKKIYVNDSQEVKLGQPLFLIE